MADEKMETIVTFKGFVTEDFMQEFCESRLYQWKKHRKNLKILILGGVHGSQNYTLTPATNMDKFANIVS